MDQITAPFARLAAQVSAGFPTISPQLDALGRSLAATFEVLRLPQMHVAPNRLALFKLLIAEWPAATEMAKIHEFIAAFSRLVSAESAAEREAAARTLAGYKAFLPAWFPRKSVRRVISAEQRRRGRAATHARVVDVLACTLVDVVRDLDRPQRLRLGPQWPKILEGFSRASPTAPAVPYPPGTVAQLVPVMLRWDRLYRFLRQRTKKLAAERLLAAEQLRLAAHRSPAAFVVAAGRPTRGEEIAQDVSESAGLEAEETLRRVLESLSVEEGELVRWRITGMPHRAIAGRLGLPSEQAARTRWCRVRAKLRRSGIGM
jgi:hypothetical protein